MKTLFATFLPLALATSLAAQASSITEERVRETVTWLAADERAGRDTGSAELVAAGEWIAERFAKTGLQQVTEGSWYHEFSWPGVRIDSDAVRATLVRKHGSDTRSFVLEPGRDVRQWTVSDTLSGEDEASTVATADDPVLQRGLQASSARRPFFAEVAEDHPMWQRAAGARTALQSRRGAARPMFLVRRGLLPARPEDGSEPAWSATWSVAAAEKVDMPHRNVMGLLRGTTKKDEYVVVSAHYDHVGIGSAVDGDAIYNGADDNATGTTGVILLAEALAKLPAPARSVLFVCFTGEERGFLGSRAFCSRCPVPLERVVANFNLEMLGRPEDGKAGKAWITGSEYSDFAAIVAPALATGGVELMPFDMATRLFSASDNWAFVEKGIVAHSLSAGSLHKDYHGPNDEADALELTHMTQILRALVPAVLELANRAEPPRWNEQGESQVRRAKR